MNRSSIEIVDFIVGKHFTFAIRSHSDSYISKAKQKNKLSFSRIQKTNRVQVDCEIDFLILFFQRSPFGFLAFLCDAFYFHLE